MKKSIITFLCLMLITLSGCTYNTKYSESDAPLTITGGLSDTLIVYYSFNGEERELAKRYSGTVSIKIADQNIPACKAIKIKS